MSLTPCHSQASDADKNEFLQWPRVHQESHDHEGFLMDVAGVQAANARIDLAGSLEVKMFFQFTSTVNSGRPDRNLGPQGVLMNPLEVPELSESLQETHERMRFHHTHHCIHIIYIHTYIPYHNITLHYIHTYIYIIYIYTVYIYIYPHVIFHHGVCSKIFRNGSHRHHGHKPPRNIQGAISLLVAETHPRPKSPDFGAVTFPGWRCLSTKIFTGWLGSPDSIPINGNMKEPQLKIMVKHWNTTWWLTYPSEKYEFVSWDDYSQYMEKS